MRALVERADRGPRARPPRRAARQRAAPQPGARRDSAAGDVARNGAAMADDATRARPEALLAEASKEGRGRLKIFLGAAPGRRQDLRHAARRRRSAAREGVDVVVGVVETHGRAETEALLARPRGPAAPQRRLPRPRASPRWTSTRCSRAARSSRWSTSSPTPTCPGSRHAKRWQDVEELLAAGIDVYTTLNIQHLESLNDVVARISRRARARDDARQGARARRRDRADRPAARGADPAPARRARSTCREQVGRAIQQLLHQGQPDGAARARACASPPSASTRRWSATCARTPSPARGRRRSASWSASTKSPVAKTLVRAAKRMAERARMPWIAVNVRTPRARR